MCAGRGEDALHAHARVRRTADHLGDAAVARIDAADAQPISIRMLLAGNDMADDKILESGGAVVQRFEFESKRCQLVRDLVQRRVGLKMVLQPGQRELHGVSPRSRVGTSSGTKP